MSAATTNPTDLRVLVTELADADPRAAVRQLAALARAAADKCCVPLVEYFLTLTVELVERLGGVSCGVNADVGWVYERLGRRAVEAGDLVEGETLLRQSITFYNDSHSDPARAAAVMRDLADMLETQNRLNEDEDLRRQALEIDETVAGVVECVKDLSALGDLLREEHRYAEAEELYKQALELTFLAWGERDSRAFDLIDYYASCRIRQGFEDDWRELASYRAALARGDHGAMFAVRPTHLLPHFRCNDGVLLREQLRKAQEKAATAKPEVPAPVSRHH